jgi:hypothetical protein
MANLGLRSDEGAAAPAVVLAGEEGAPTAVGCGGVRTEETDMELDAGVGEGVAELTSGRMRARRHRPQEKTGELGVG